MWSRLLPGGGLGGWGPACQPGVGLLALALALTIRTLAIALLAAATRVASVSSAALGLPGERSVVRVLSSSCCSEGGAV